jgi:uncharacterized membrane protein (DUF485 family)
MSYTLKHHSPQQHHFKQNALYGIFTFIFIIVGLLAATISGYLVYIGVDTKGWAITVTCLGITFIMAGIYIPQTRAKYDAKEVIFDHENRLVILKGKDKQATISYDKITKVDYREKAMSSSSSSGTTTRHYKYFNYFATENQLLTWEFHDSHSKKTAEKIQQELYAHIFDTTKVAKAAIALAPQFPDILQVKTNNSSYKIVWKNNILNGLLVLVAIISVIGRVIWQMWQEMRNEPFALIGFGFFALIFAFILIIIGKNLYEDYLYEYSFEISPQKLSYSKQKSAYQADTQSWTKDELLGLAFHFTIEEHSNGFQIMTKTQKELQQHTQANMKFDKATLTNLINTSKGTILLKINNLDAIDSLKFQQIVNLILVQDKLT